MTSIRQLADKQRTCVSTIHQPSAEVFALFDKVALLARGQLIFYGAISDAVRYFENLIPNYFLKQNQNPAEFIIEASSKCDEDFAEYCSIYFRSKCNSSKENRPATQNSNSSLTYGRKHVTTKVTQFLMLVHRDWTSMYRNKMDLKTSISKNVVVGLLLGIVFFRRSNISPPFFDFDPTTSNFYLNTEATNMTSVLFFMIMYCLFSNLEVIPHLCLRDTIYRRELASFAYSPSPYWAASSVTHLPKVFLLQLLNVLIGYFMCDFPHDFDFFLYLFLILFLCTLSSYYFAQFLAAASRNVEIAFAIFPLTFVFFTQFAGYSVSVNNLPEGWKWASYVSYVRWCAFRSIYFPYK